jgi:hypothetical protein
MRAQQMHPQLKRGAGLPMRVDNLTPTLALQHEQTRPICL